MPRSAVAVVALGVAWSLPARAGVLAEDPLEDTSTEAGIVARAFSFVLAGKVLEPPLSVEDANPTAQGAFDLRLYAAHKTSRWKLVLHDQLAGVARAHALGGLAIGRGVAPPRWLPLSVALVDEPTLTIRDTVDWAYAAYTRGPATVTVGRQPVSFGRAKLWSPMDLIAPFALTEVDTEYRPGADALRVDLAATDRVGISVVGVVGELADDHDLQVSRAGSAVVGRIKRRLSRGEAGAIAGVVRGDLVAGVDGTWDTGSFELYGETTVTTTTSRSATAPTAAATFGKAAIGVSSHPAHTLTLDAELLYNGAGASHAVDYLAVASAPRIALGEQVTLGRYYATAVADWQPHPLVHVVAATIANLRDPSGLVSVALAYSVAGNANAKLGAYAPLGRRPDGLVPRSEFGLYPVFGFLELEAVL